MTLFASIFPIACWLAYNLGVPLVERRRPSLVAAPARQFLFHLLPVPCVTPSSTAFPAIPWCCRLAAETPSQNSGLPGRPNPCRLARFRSPTSPALPVFGLRSSRAFCFRLKNKKPFQSAQDLSPSNRRIRPATPTLHHRSPGHPAKARRGAFLPAPAPGHFGQSAPGRPRLPHPDQRASPCQPQGNSDFRQRRSWETSTCAGCRRWALQ